MIICWHQIKNIKHKIARFCTDNMIKSA